MLTAPTRMDPQTLVQATARNAIIRCFPLCRLACLISQDLVEQLSHGAFGLENRTTMVHDSSQIRIGTCNTAEGRSSQDFAGRGLSVPAEEKAGLRIEVGVPPAVKNDSFYIPPCIKTGGAKHFSKLLADFSFVIAERGCQHFSP